MTLFFPEPTPIFCNCSWQLHPFLLPEHGLIWILAIGNLNQVCRNDPETHSVLPVFASWPDCATYVFGDAWKLYLHRSGSAGVTCGTAPLLPDVPEWRQEPSTQVSCLACEAWQVLAACDNSESWKQTCSSTIKWANTAGLVQETMRSDSRGKSGFVKHLGFGKHLHLLLLFQG